MHLIPVLFSVAALTGMALPAAAQSLPIEVGLATSFTSNDERTWIASAAWLPELYRNENSVLRWDVGGMYVHGRSNHLDNMSEDVGVLYVGARYEHTIGFIAGLGAGAQVGHTDALSGGPQFISSIGWRWQRVSLLARHISNASTNGPNDGETMVMATWRFF